MTESEDIFKGCGVEIELAHPDDFLKIKETLQRIGIPSYKDGKTLYQSCHILHKRNRYVIIHFLELFRLDGRASSFTEEDKARRDSIALMLADWGLLKIKDNELARLQNEDRQHVRIKVISFKEKDDWNLKCKYHVGSRK